MRTEDLKRLRANQYFLVQELERRGAKVEPLDLDNELLRASVGAHHELLLNIDSSIMGYPASIVASEKPVAKALLQEAGISVPRGATFSADEAGRAAAFAESIGYPVVVKPPHGVQGDDVFVGIEYPSELREIFDLLRRRWGNARLMVEEHFFGKEYRVFVTRKGDFAVLHRDPAYVVGDGLSSIRELAEAESYRRLHPRANCLCTIVLDAAAEGFLRKRGLSFDSVPAEGEKVYLRGNSNVKTGGMAEDATDLMHPSVREIALRALAAFPGLPYAGIDFMCADISLPQSTDSYRVIEINSLPGIGMHLSPGRGKSRNVAGMIVDMMFPETMPLRLAA